jgi:hypothetical protein
MSPDFTSLHLLLSQSHHQQNVVVVVVVVTGAHSEQLFEKLALWLPPSPITLPSTHCPAIMEDNALLLSSLHFNPSH